MQFNTYTLIILSFVLSLGSRTSHAQGPASPPRDTVFVYERVVQTRADQDEELSIPALTRKRDHAGKMQRTGFGLLMGGIAMAAGGVALMVIGINENIDANNQQDEYGYYYEDEESNDGMGLVFVGYISAIASPGLIIPGIILNRKGNSRRLRYEAELEDRSRQGFRFDAGPNSVKLSYSF